MIYDLYLLIYQQTFISIAYVSTPQFQLQIKLKPNDNGKIFTYFNILCILLSQQKWAQKNQFQFCDQLSLVQILNLQIKMKEERNTNQYQKIKTKSSREISTKQQKKNSLSMQIQKSKAESSTNVKKQLKLKICRRVALFVSLVFLCIVIFSSAQAHNSQILQIAIVGTNDLHGTAFPTELTHPQTGQKYKYGGLVYLAQMIQTLKKEYKGNLLYLDAGDQFQGGVQSSQLVSSGQIMNQFFKIAGLNASSIGNHEFDIGKGFLQKFFQGRTSSNLAANLLSEKGQANFLPHHQSSKLFKMPNGISVGVIGLATLQTLATTAGFARNLFPPYKFLQYKDIVLQESKKLKQNGANVVILVSHMGDNCESSESYSVHNSSKQQLNLQQQQLKSSNDQKCPKDQLSLLIDSLPDKTIDAVVQGHRHKFSHRYYRNIPCIGSINNGFYFNVIYLRFSMQKKLIGSSIQGPIPICQKIFSQLKRCQYLGQQMKHDAHSQPGQLINWQFHNKTVQPHKQLEQIFKSKYQQKLIPFFNILFTSQIILSRYDLQQYPLANLFTQLLFKSANRSQNTDAISMEGAPLTFSFLNTGMFRTKWFPGQITTRDFYNMFPFQNFVQTFQITGKSLYDSLKIIQSGKRFMQFYGLKMKIKITKQFVNGYEKQKKQLTSVTLSDGSQLQMDKIYKGVSIQYLIQGGDQFSLVKGKQFEPKNIQIIGQFRSVIRPLLQKLGTIKQNNLIDKKNPRLIVEYQTKKQKMNKF